MKILLAIISVAVLLGSSQLRAQVGTLNYQSAVDNYVEVRTQANEVYYNYAPDVIYFNGMYHMYWCGGVGAAGDYILHAQSAVPWGPFASAATSAEFSYDVALNPTWNSANFDGYETCDPSVMQVDGLFYLYYGGLGTQSNNSSAGAIGVATSTDGIHFSRANGGYPIVSPNGWVPNANIYGVGQPAVFFITPYFYMSFTDTTASAGSGQYLLRALDPLFQSGVQELVGAGSWADRGANSHTGQYRYLEAFSVDISYDTASNKVFVASDQEQGQNWVYILNPTTFTSYGYLSMNGTWDDGSSIAKNPDRTMFARPSCRNVDINLFKGDSATGQNSAADVATWNISRSEATFTLANEICNPQGAVIALINSIILGD